MENEHKKKVIVNVKSKNIQTLVTIVIVGVVLIISANVIFTEPKVDTAKISNTGETSQKSEYDLETELENILEKIDGVGKVDILITYSQGMENVYSENKSIVKQVYPKVQGVIVVAEGANNEAIRNNIKKAVEVVTGVGEYKIEVLKKGERSI